MASSAVFLESPDPVAAGPIVKWAGGKSPLRDALQARSPRRFRRYFEPFLGGAALYFRLAPRFGVLSDCNADLINMYRCAACGDLPTTHLGGRVYVITAKLQELLSA